jgi:ribonuclease R
MSDFADRVLAYVSGAEYRPKTAKALAKYFKVDADDYPEFRLAVKRLIKEGKLDVSKDKTIRRPEREAGIIGTFRRSSRGFGFVRPLKADRKADQIYIPPESSGDASSGDEVIVKIIKRPKRAGMNLEGKIIRIVSRASGVFVGTYFERGGGAYVQIDGTSFRDPISVGDPGAKGAKPGEKVAIEMVCFPTPFVEGEGVITEILGERGQPGVDTLTVIRAFNIPDTFDDSVLDEAREQAKGFSEEDVSGRLDLRDTLTVTIDPATARDFDDAISLTRDERGFWNLGVHIADVSHFVRPGSDIDQSARHRGTSVYLPDRVIPMLPEVLSNGLASLQQGRVRYTVSAFLEFDDSGVVTDRRFARSVVRVDHRFSYEQAFEVMKAPDREHEGISPEIRQMLGRMLELAMILRQRRYTRGALELALPEVAVELDGVGQVSGAHLVEHDQSHQVIEEFMLAANEAVASFLTQHHAPFLRRAHPDPEPYKLDEFAEFVRGLGIKLDLPQSRFELQRVLRETSGTPEEYAVHYGLLRSLKQASYTPEQEGHYALASDDYCHFTSPIRRYPDLQVHRQVLSILEGKRPRGTVDELAVLGEQCTRTERRAEAAERELIRVKLLTYLVDRLGEAYHAVIVGVEDFGVFCRLIEFPVEGLIHVTSLSDDFYYLEAGTHTLIGRRSGRRYRLGDRIEVRIAHVDVDRRVLDLVTLDSPLGSGRRPIGGGVTRGDRTSSGHRREGPRPDGRGGGEARGLPDAAEPSRTSHPRKKSKASRGPKKPKGKGTTGGKSSRKRKR